MVKLRSEGREVPEGNFLPYQGTRVKNPVRAAVRMNSSPPSHSLGTRAPGGIRGFRHSRIPV